MELNSAPEVSTLELSMVQPGFFYCVDSFSNYPGFPPTHQTIQQLLPPTISPFFFEPYLQSTIPLLMPYLIHPDIHTFTNPFIPLPFYPLIQPITQPSILTSIVEDMQPTIHPGIIELTTPPTIQSVAPPSWSHTSAQTSLFDALKSGANRSLTWAWRSNWCWVTMISHSSLPVLRLLLLQEYKQKTAQTQM